MKNEFHSRSLGKELRSRSFPTVPSSLFTSTFFDGVSKEDLSSETDFRYTNNMSEGGEFVSKETELTSTKEVAHKTAIQDIQHMDIADFASTYSAETPPPSHFSDKVGFFTTNEYDYSESLKDIKVRGGIHLAVMGGVDPVLGQVAIAKPDLTIMTDINPSSLQVTTKGRIDPLAKSQDAKEYWGQVGDYFKDTVKKLDPSRYDFPIDQDSTSGGWSSPEHFSEVKQAVSDGKVKWAAGDLTKDGIDLALQLARETNTPVKLVYVSNIFHYSENDKANFAERLAKGIEDGTVDPNAQIIDTATEEGLKTEIYDIGDYIQTSITQS